MKENLNMAWWRKLLIKTALKRYETKKEAAKVLGISTRTLEKY